MTYFVIGLMSGSSCDGLDICYCHLTFISGKRWEYSIEQTECIPYSDDFKNKLKTAAKLSVPEFLKLDKAFARLCAEKVNAFITRHDLEHKVFFIASHGHTVWHEPTEGISCQIGDGATIAALTGYPTISDLRNMDVALGGQGAPIVPIADQLLFPDYDFCLNLGGIANLTINTEEPVAFDICPANQLLNHFAQKKGLPFDEDGKLAASGNCNQSILERINQNKFYYQKAPKSLSNSFSAKEIIPFLWEETDENALNTACKHIATQIARALLPYCSEEKEYKLLITGGGAMNAFLVRQIQQEIEQMELPVAGVLLDETSIKFKEALAMSLIATLRWREETNVLSSVTGASRNSIGGAFWMGK